jgi:spore coat protein CotH
MRRILAIAFCVSMWSFGLVTGQNQTDFYDIDHIQDINISFEQENWRDILDSLRYNGSNMLAGTVTINGKNFDGAQVRYRNARAFQIGGMHNSLYIELPDGETYQGYSIIELSNALRDPSVIREVMAYEIARKYMPAPKANYAKTSINGDYYGFFVNVESVVDPKFLTEHFGSADGELYHAEIAARQALPEGCKADAYASLQYDGNEACYTYSFDRVTTRSWDNLVELTRVLNEEPESIERILDVDRTLWLLAFNNVLVNLNSYTGHPSQNYYLYRDRSGRFTLLPGDQNFSFGSYKNADGGSDLNFAGLVKMNPMLHEDNEDRPLISNLLENDEYRKRYLSHMRQILYDNFAKDQHEKRARELQSIIKEPWVEDPNKEYNLVDFTKSLNETIGKRSKIPGLVEFMNLRSEYLQRHPELSVVPPTISDVTVQQRERFSPNRIEDFKISAKVGDFTKNVWLYYRFSSDDSFRQIPMMDDGEHNDEAADDTIFGAQVQPPNGVKDIEFYIVAENAKSISFSPAHYMYEQHTANLDELNQ